MLPFLTLSPMQEPLIPPSKSTQLVFLGTGNPNPDPLHQGPSLAIVVNGQPYFVDCGPGLVRQAAAAARKGVEGFSMAKMDRLFVTHLHSDHTVGLPDIIFTPAVTGREHAIQIYGPKGIGAMVDHINKAWSLDKEIRFHGGEPSLPKAYETEVHEVKSGSVYKDDNVKVSAIPVKHGHWEAAFGYRFETPDRVIVISGDTTYCPALIEAARGCDILVHEVYSAEGLKKRTPDWQAYHSTYHTSGPDLGSIATLVKPKLLVLYHELRMGMPDGEIVKEVATTYDGKVVEAADLDVF
ncbi:MAG: MBL fold metallo-hydrolase [bacterium]